MSNGIETVTFCSVGSNRFSLQLKPERKNFSNSGEVEIIEPMNAEFENGVCKTDDPEKIELIRKSIAFREKRVIELKPGDKEPSPPRQETIKGPITSSDFREELDLSKEKNLVKISEQGITSCPHCDLVFEDDWIGRKVRMHNIAKHRNNEIKILKAEEK